MPTYRESITCILNETKADAESGQSALAPVESSVVRLENDQIFIAGKGSVLNAKGFVE